MVKRLLVVLLIVIALTISIVGATNLNFQNPTDFNSHMQCIIKPWATQAQCTWIESGTGGNNYVDMWDPVYEGYDSSWSQCMILDNPYQTTYAAGTYLGYEGSAGNCGMVALFDASKTTTFAVGYSAGSCAISKNTRIEMKMDGGRAKIYKNGALLSTSGVINNPYYVGLCGHGAGTSKRNSWDDYVYGQTENKYVAGLPESDNDTFIILKDIVNPASSGLAYGDNGTIVSSNFMTGTWSRGNTSIDAGTTQPNESFQLVNYLTKKVIVTNYTGSAYLGTITYNINDLLIASGEPQGYYAIYFPNQMQYSNPILFKSNGASVTWNEDTYSVGDTGTAIYYILSGGYWDTSLYSYRVSIVDSYGQYLQNTSLTASSGSVDFTFTEDNPEGVYYAILTATNHDGYEYILGSDYATLVSYFAYGGYVNNGYNTSIITDANITITQGLTAAEILSSGYDGNYSSSPVFSTGSSVFFNATKTGFKPYQYSFTPLAAKSVKNLNITLYPLDPLGEYGGIGIGGVVRDATIGRPLPGATVYVYNTSTAESYTKTTNVAGGYICSIGDLCSLVPNQMYKINASKTGYNTSIDYNVLAFGRV
jgi:hypothetical protein